MNNTRLRRAVCAAMATATLAVGMAVGDPPPTASAAESTDEFSFDRVEGVTRYDTAANVALRDFAPSAAVAVLASGESYADALAAAPVAGALKAPVLLTSKSALPPATMSALNSLAVDKVVIVGGSAAIGEPVESAVRSMGLDVERISGVDRYATAAALSSHATAAQSSPPSLVFVVGEGFADALAVAPIAYAQRAPVLLTTRTALPAVTRDALVRLAPERVIVAGGRAAVSDMALGDIEQLAIPVTRIAGSNRTETAYELASWATSALGFTNGNVAIARGDAFPDALAASASAGRRLAPLVLVPSPNNIGGAALRWLTSHAGMLTEGTIFGSTAAVSDSVETIATTASKVGTSESTATAGSANTMVEPSDVLAAAGDSTSGAKLTLRATAPRPVVGGQITVAPGRALPAGLYGRVTEIMDTADGQMDVTVAPAALQEGFSDLQMHYDGVVSDPATAVATQSTADTSATAYATNTRFTGPFADAFECEQNGAEIKAPAIDKPLISLAFEHLSVNQRISLSSDFVLFQLNGEVVISTNITAEANLKCKIKPSWATQHQLQITIPGQVPVVVELSPLFEFQLSGGSSIDLGTRLYFSRGFIYDRGELEYRQAGSATPHGSIAGYVEGSVFAGADIAVKAWDVAGIFLKLGPELVARGSVSPTAACASVTVGGRADLGLRLDLWVKRWEATAVQVRLPENHIFPEQCFRSSSEPAPDPAARGKIIRQSTGEAFFVSDQLVAHPIPNGGTYLCLTAWKGTQVINDVSASYVSRFDVGAPHTCVVTEARDRVIRNADGGSWYVDGASVAHHIPDGGTYLCLTAWKDKQVIDGVSADQVSALPGGAPQTCQATEAKDKIVRRADETSWYVDGNVVAHPIPNGGTYLCLATWKGKQVLDITDDQARALPTGSEQTCQATEAKDKIVRRPDGASWYVDGNVVAHPIPNGGTYLCLKAWKGKQVLNVSDDHVRALPTGGTQSCEATEARDKVIRKADGTSWFVDGNLVAHHIPNGGTYNCLVQVHGFGLINNITQEHADALPHDSPQRCAALLVGPDGTSFHIDSTDERKWVPDGDTFVCLENRGVRVFRYSNWDKINLFVDRSNWATCG